MTEDAMAARGVEGPVDVQVERQPRTRLAAALGCGLAGLMIFLAVQALLAAHNVHVIEDAIRAGLLRGYPERFRSLPLRLLANLLPGAIAYACMSLAGIAIGATGHRILFAAPAALFVFTSAATGPDHAAQAIGLDWGVECFVDCSGPWFAHPWIGPTLDLVLVLAPGWVASRSGPARRWPPERTAPAYGAIASSLALLVVAAWATQVITQRPLDAPAFAAAAAIGLILGTARPWWPWVGLLFAGAVTGMLGTLAQVLLGRWPDAGMKTVWYVAELGSPTVLAALIASMWEPLLRFLQRGARKPLLLAAAVNLLNIVDALLTAAVVRAGGGTEANPVVRLLGLPAKVILVAAITWVIYRVRPSALAWPALALFCVLGYHIAGLLVNA